MYKLKVYKGSSPAPFYKKGAEFEDEASALTAAIQHGGCVRVVRYEDSKTIAEIKILCEFCGRAKTECHRCDKPIFCFCHRGVRLCDSCEDYVKSLPPEPDPDEEFWK